MKKFIFISVVISFFAACKKDELKPRQLYNFTDTTYTISGTPGIDNQEYFCLYPHKSIILDATVSDSSATYLWQPGGESTPTIEVDEEINSLTVDISSNTLGNIHIFMGVNICTPLVFVPSSFTPNSDFVNDNWKPVCTSYFNYGITETLYEVKDNEGIKLFSTDNRNQGWDGTYKGANMPSGFYLYYINYSTLTHENNILTGSLELIR